MKHALYLYTGSGDAGERAEQYSAKGITQGNAVSAFKGLDNKSAVLAVLA